MRRDSNEFAWALIAITFIIIFSSTPSAYAQSTISVQYRSGLKLDGEVHEWEYPPKVFSEDWATGTLSIYIAHNREHLYVAAYIPDDTSNSNDTFLVFISRTNNRLETPRYDDYVVEIKRDGNVKVKRVTSGKETTHFQCEAAVKSSSDNWNVELQVPYTSLLINIGEDKKIGIGFKVINEGVGESIFPSGLIDDNPSTWCEAHSLSYWGSVNLKFTGFRAKVLPPYEDYYTGVKVRMEIEVLNQGDAPVSGVEIRILLDGEELQTYNIESSIEKGAEYKINFNWTATEGIHNFTIVVDPNNLISESNEGDNRAEKLLSVRSPILAVEAPDGITVTVNGVEYNVSEGVASIPVQVGKVTIGIEEEHREEGVKMTFKRWVEGGENPTIEVNVTGDMTLTARYDIFYRVGFRFLYTKMREENGSQTFEYEEFKPNVVKLFVGENLSFVYLRNNFEVWLPSGELSIYNVTWRGVNVIEGVINKEIYESAQIDLICKVIDAKVKVTDPLGFGVDGAEVWVKLPNGDKVNGTTIGGYTILEKLPATRLTCTIKYLGLSYKTTLDLTSDYEFEARVVFSLSVVAIVVAITAILVIIVVYALMRTRAKYRVKRRKKPRAPYPPPQSPPQRLPPPPPPNQPPIYPPPSSQTSPQGWQRNEQQRREPTG
ncbi:MAG TPA: hypothetical protein ENF41_02680 [Candidatus Bathyarchaeota archaeon]|nr:hypothetical protein [Candidatus Bathyarchaeota archaeon]